MARYILNVPCTLGLQWAASPLTLHLAVDADDVEEAKAKIAEMFAAGTGNGVCTIDDDPG